MASSTPAPAALQQPLAHDTPAVAPAPDAALTPVAVAPRPAPVYKPTPVAAKKAPAAKQAKSGPNVGLIAGAAVAAITVIAAGVGVMMSGKKAAPEPAKKAPSRTAAAARPAAKAGSAKAPTRTSSSGGGAAKAAGTRSSSTARRSTSAAAAAPAAEATPAPAAAEEPAAAAAAAAAAVEEPVATQDAAPAAAEEPAAAAAAVEEPAAVPEAAPAAAEAAAPAAEEAAAAAADDAEGAAAAEEADGEDGEGLIELAEGETLPVVDEAGNTLGTLHADGRVLDDAGQEIGMLDDDGNVVLFEQQAAEEPQLSPAEEEAEQLMRQAAVAWNVQHNKDAAEKFQRKAMEAVTAKPGLARPEIIAEVASSLADMLYASDKLVDAKGALQVALDAAEAGGQHALYIKLSNNMGAVLRKQELHEEGKQLHQKAMDVALQHFGVAHATTTLARGNLVDALDQLGDRDAARELLNGSIDAIKKVADDKEAEEVAKGLKPGSEEAAAAAAAAAKQASSPEMAAMLAIDSTRAHTASIRVQIELARLEMKAKAFDRAVEVLQGAHALAVDKFGEETPEASSAMAALATCHRQAGNLETSASLFEQLYSINERQSEGPVNQSGVMLARTLADVLGEAERWGDALVWAEKALSLMQQMAGVKVHPALEPFFALVIELKHKTGDEAGAEELRKQLLKGKLQMAGQSQRAGAAAGRPPTGQQAGKQAGGKAAGNKRSTKRK
ncbi:hypothetical protein OEZ85_014298 [Tetradesmus obliquus]|uniref:MalT-like TPR region domain-containing protein n=1 Tax=Tetradesmus obliquus TaxID=3088 RepID=A0ABY8U7P3_TETOB|nr:hypothetical protein OEZ85_014298 [Tetradesmus obliquus]